MADEKPIILKSQTITHGRLSFTSWRKIEDGNLYKSNDGKQWSLMDKLEAGEADSYVRTLTTRLKWKRVE